MCICVEFVSKLRYVATNIFNHKIYFLNVSDHLLLGNYRFDTTTYCATIIPYSKRFNNKTKRTTVSLKLRYKYTYRLYRHYKI